MYFLTLYFLSFLTSSYSDFVLVETSRGIVRGNTRKINGWKVTEFLGIPYARPPVNRYRFKPPMRLFAFTSSILNATSHGSICPQVSKDRKPPKIPKRNTITITLHDVPSIGEDLRLKPIEPRMSEDCLFLNIFAPEISGVSLSMYPVLFYIHGGGLTMGSANMMESEAILKNLVSRGIIVVTMNYRLGPLGFFTTGTGEAPGNYGLLDQMEALSFIHSEIRAFGGDPAKITLAGGSAGAQSALLLSLSPLARGLFRNLMIMSTPGAQILDEKEVFNGDLNEQFASLLGCGLDSLNGSIQHSSETHQSQNALLWPLRSSMGFWGGSSPMQHRKAATFDAFKIVDCLRTRTVEEIIEAQTSLDPSKFWRPSVDGSLLPVAIKDLINNRTIMGSVMIGTTMAEMAFQAKLGLIPVTQSEVEMREIAIPQLIENAGLANRLQVRKALEYQFIDLPQLRMNPYVLSQESWFNLDIQMQSLYQFYAPAYTEASTFMNSGIDVFLYSIDFPGEQIQLPFGTWEGATHGIEMNLLMNSKRDSSPESKMMTAYLSTMVTNFVKYQNPTPIPLSGVAWLPLQQNLRNYLSIDTFPKMLRGYHAEDILFWSKLIQGLSEVTEICDRAKGMANVPLFVYYSMYC